MGEKDRKAKLPRRPKQFLDVRGQDFQQVQRRRGTHYAIRFSELSLLVACRAAERMAWKILFQAEKVQGQRGAA